LLTANSLPHAAKIPTPHASGLAWSFCSIPHAIPSVVYFCHTFCIAITHIAHCLYRSNPSLQSKIKAKSNSSPQITKSRVFPMYRFNTLVPEINNPKLSYIIYLIGAATQCLDQSKAVSYKGYYVK